MHVHKHSVCCCFVIVYRLEPENPISAFRGLSIHDM